MADCCESKSCALEAMRERQSGTLRIVLVVNAVMFAVVLIAGWLAASTALLADSLDNLGDAVTYGISLYAVYGTARAKAKVALVKGCLILSGGLFVAGQVVHKIVAPGVPVAETMGAIAFLALIANGTCLALLWKHRREDINMSSVWQCSRNDIASNLSVMVAAAAVWLTGSGWADVIVGGALACLFIRSAWSVLRAALVEMQQPPLGLSGRR